MRNRLGLIVMVSISLITIQFLSSWSATNPPSYVTGTTKVLAKDTVPLLPRYNISGDLDILWMTAASFKLLDEKVTFRFYIEAADKLTLRGWSSDNDDYNALPDVILFNGQPSTTAKFGPTNYFGNLQLKGKSIRKIIRQLNPPNPPMTYVLFVPDIPGTNAGQINYTIMLTNDDPSKPLLVGKQAVPTGVNTNPSPPRRGV